MTNEESTLTALQSSLTRVEGEHERLKATLSALEAAVTQVIERGYLQHMPDECASEPWCQICGATGDRSKDGRAWCQSCVRELATEPCSCGLDTLKATLSTLLARSAAVRRALRQGE